MIKKETGEFIMRTLIKNCKAVTPEGIQNGCVLIEEGKIAAFGLEQYMPKDVHESIDAGGKYLIPGALDLHVHFRDPGLTYKEDFTTGSRAAAMGGVTTIFDMPNTQPPVVDVKSFEVKHRIAEEKSFVNYGLYAYLLDGNADDIDALVDAGVAGFKWDMSAADWELPKGYHVPDNTAALCAFKRIAKHGYNVGVHAEDMTVVNFFIEELKRAGRKDYRAHAESRQDYVEVAALQRAALLAEITGCHLHVHHLSSRRGLEFIKQKREEGLSISCGVGPQWFLFCADDYEKMGCLIKTYPAIKEKEDAQALWQGLQDGSVDCMETDHAPHSYEEKYGTSWYECTPGANGVETSMPLMLDKINKGELTIERYVQFACEAPAKLYGLYPRKGVIRIGADADLVLVDMDKVWTIKKEEIQSKNHLTPFDGWTIQGKPVMTMVNGNIIMKDGVIVGQPCGKLVNPKKAW